MVSVSYCSEPLFPLIFAADRRADRRPERRFYRSRRGPPRRPRPPPQDSQGEDKTEGDEGMCVGVCSGMGVQ